MLQIDHKTYSIFPCFNHRTQKSSEGNANDGIIGDDDVDDEMSKVFSSVLGKTKNIYIYMYIAKQQHTYYKM